VIYVIYNISIFRYKTHVNVNLVKRIRIIFQDIIANLLDLLASLCCKLALYIVLSIFLTVLRRIGFDILKKYKEEEKEDIMLVVLYVHA